jgi:hypothetical protein
MVCLRYIIVNILNKGDDKDIIIIIIIIIITVVFM